MEIISADFKKGIAHLRITDPEDLWYLRQLIDPGDLITGKTTRKIKVGEAETKSIKKTYTLKIEAENTELSPAGQNLRINGRIKESPEELPLNSYQSITLELASEFTLEKINWMEYQKQKLKEATEKKYSYLLCVFDREEALLALTKKFGYEVLLKISGDVQKKGNPTESKKDFYLEIIAAIESYSQRYQPERIILASPAFYKEDIFRKISAPELKKKITLAICSDVSESSLHEVLRRPELAEALKSSRLRQENILLEELLTAINKNGLAVYGEAEVKKAVEAGAVSKLLLTDDFITKLRTNNRGEELDVLMKKVDSLQAEIHIISAEQESGKRLTGLGGIAAILRYKLVW